MIRKALLVVCGVTLVTMIALTAVGILCPTGAVWYTSGGKLWAQIKPGALAVGWGGSLWLRERWPIDAAVGQNVCWLFVSVWLPLAVLVVAFWLLVRSMIRARRRRPGSCLTCGYDLTGNTSGRCPECGAVATQPTLARATPPVVDG